VIAVGTTADELFDAQTGQRLAQAAQHMTRITNPQRTDVFILLISFIALKAKFERFPTDPI
jgi:hypothetical protein